VGETVLVDWMSVAVGWGDVAVAPTTGTVLAGGVCWDSFCVDEDFSREIGVSLAEVQAVRIKKTSMAVITRYIFIITYPSSRITAPPARFELTTI